MAFQPIYLPVGKKFIAMTNDYMGETRDGGGGRGRGNREQTGSERGGGGLFADLKKWKK